MTGATYDPRTDRSRAVDLGRSGALAVTAVTALLVSARSDRAALNLVWGFSTPTANASAVVGPLRNGAIVPLAVVSANGPRVLLTREEVGDVLAEDLYVLGIDAATTIGFWSELVWIN